MTPEHYCLPLSACSSAIMCAFLFNQYKQVWTYTGLGELIVLLKGITLSAAVTGVIQYAVYHTMFFRLLTACWVLQLLSIEGPVFYPEY